jgi:Chaperone of endosialidase
MQLKRRPSPALIVALLALFVALGGAGVAATGGNFILGASNTADKTTALTVNTLPPTCPSPCEALQVTDNNTALNAGGLGVLGKSPSAPAATIKNSGGAPALNLLVNAGRPPFTVNSSKVVTNLNADLLDGLHATGLPYWKLGGNSGTSPGTNFIGTIDAKPLELKVNGQRALRLEPATDSSGLGIFPNIIGGFSGNAVGAGAFGATIAGGGWSPYPNSVTAHLATVGGGDGNTASGPRSVVGGGNANTASGAGAAIGGGTANTVSGINAAIGGGQLNSASGDRSVVVGGSGNGAAGPDATVAGGAFNVANGDASLAAGSHAVASQNGSFVWGDDHATTLTSPAANTFTVRASGGIWLGTNSSPSIPLFRFIQTSTGAFLSLAGVWTNNSDRAKKHDFRALSRQTVLERVASMPITSWSYKSENPSVRHIGPTAQDFHQAFGLGLDDKHIGTIDEGGVALAAIQGLYRQNQALRRKNSMLISRLASHNARLTKLEREVASSRANPPRKSGCRS